ncbi:hypothetical protein LZ32DRAFT_443951 [Colletotrichum eremochloae]|nr:hypothetical protein LZ32DRAFT_443951 [Colletotrichum eremochloae]
MRSLSHSEQYRIFSNQSASSNYSRGTERTSSTIRRRHARDIFAEFGISRPSGWLSDDEGEDFSRHQDGANSIPRHVFNICHSCGAEVTSRTSCSTCGHAVCPQCASEMPDDEASLGAEHIENTHPGVLTSEQPTLNATEERGRSSPPPKVMGISKKSRPASTSTPLKDNPFIRADRKMKTAVAEPQITDIAARAGQASRLSDCVPKQADLSIVDTHRDYENHRCNATHAAHHSDLNNIVCMMEQQVPVGNRGDSDQLIQHHSLADPVQDKIDKMYHHAEDLKRAQHIMEHLAAGFIPTKGATQVSQDKILKATRASAPSMENLLSQAGGFGLNQEKLVSLDMTMAEDRKYTRA